MAVHPIAPPLAALHWPTSKRSVRRRALDDDELTTIKVESGVGAVVVLTEQGGTHVAFGGAPVRRSNRPTSGGRGSSGDRAGGAGTKRKSIPHRQPPEANPDAEARHVSGMAHDGSNAEQEASHGGIRPVSVTDNISPDGSSAPPPSRKRRKRPASSKAGHQPATAGAAATPRGSSHGVASVELPTPPLTAEQLAAIAPLPLPVARGLLATNPAVATTLDAALLHAWFNGMGRAFICSRADIVAAAQKRPELLLASPDEAKAAVLSLAAHFGITSPYDVLDGGLQAVLLRRGPHVLQLPAWLRRTCGCTDDLVGAMLRRSPHLLALPRDELRRRLSTLGEVFGLKGAAACALAARHPALLALAEDEVLQRLDVLQATLAYKVSSPGHGSPRYVTASVVCVVGQRRPPRLCCAMVSVGEPCRRCHRVHQLPRAVCPVGMRPSQTAWHADKHAI